MTMIRIHPQLSPFTMRRSQLFSSLDQGAGASRLEAGVETSDSVAYTDFVAHASRRAGSLGIPAQGLIAVFSRTGSKDAPRTRRQGCLRYTDFVAHASQRAGSLGIPAQGLFAVSAGQGARMLPVPAGRDACATWASQPRLLASLHPVDQAIDSGRIALLQFRRQRLVGEILETHRPQEPLNGPCAH
jgi:hypothetical protein